MMDQVTLTVSAGLQPRNETWWRYTTGTNDQLYAFFFGDKNGKDSGHLWTVKDGNKMNFMVHLAQDPKANFEIHYVELHYGDDQFSYDLNGSNGKLAVIRNLNAKVVQGMYCVVVLDAATPKGFVYCDPMISNLPH